MKKDYKKPETAEELTQDRRKHPERGMVKDVDGDFQEIFRQDSVEIRLKIPRELYRELLMLGATIGESKAGIVLYAIQRMIGDVGMQALKTNFIARKAEQYNISPFEVYKKVLGVYKAGSRKRRENLKSGGDEQ